MTLPIRDARKYVFAAAAVLVVLDLVCIGILISPWGRSRNALQATLVESRQELDAKLREVGPSRGMDGKLQTVSVKTAEFYQQRLPALYSEIDDALGDTEKQSGVHVSSIRYAAQTDTRREELETPEGLRRVNIVLDISGRYVETVKFINALERSKVFFVIQSVNLAGESVAGERSRGGDTTVGLQLGVETYLRRGAA